MKTGFTFTGNISGSKSLLNRAYIIKSYFEDFNIYGDSPCNDVQIMKQAALDLACGKTTIYCGEAGTVLRFMALRLAREEGEFLITGSDRLLSRLPNDLIQLLSQLGSKVELTSEGFKLKSVGWKIMGDALHLQAKSSSQFATSVFLNAWQYPLDLFITVPQSMASMSYFKMTLTFLSSLGMSIFSNKTEFHIPKNQIIATDSYVCEQDVSSLFALAAAATINGEATINGVTDNSIQPDIKFLKLFDEMNIDYNFSDTNITFFKQNKIRPVEANLKNCPDLFPVLSILCAFADGESKLFGAKHLVHKESDRIDMVSSLLQKVGVNFERNEDGLIIFGNPNMVATEFSFNANNDHRIAMAVGLLMLKGFNIDLAGKDSVNKSFPDFWDIVGL